MTRILVCVNWQRGRVVEVLRYSVAADEAEAVLAMHRRAWPGWGAYLA